MVRVFFLLLVCISLMTTAPAHAAPAERASTVSDRELVNLTIYNGTMSLVHDRRNVSLSSGINRIAWRDVSAIMDPTSALLEDLSSHNRVDVLEQNFNFDVLDPAALLQKSIGREVTIVHEPRFAGERETREQARILSATNGIVLQYKDRIETQLRGYIIYPEIPSSLRDQPTLTLEIQSEHGARQTLDLSYMTGGLSWHADYVGTLASDEGHLSITGLVTLSNTSGVSYENARLQLVAGNVNVVQMRAMGDLVKAGTTADVYSANSFSQENYFEYHLYTMSRPSTILDKQTKQIALLQAQNVPVRKTLELRGAPQYYRSAQPDLGDRLPLGVYVTFENKGGQLGIPLPGGIVRLYKNDSRGLSQFLGSDRIDHTPKNETVRLHLGNSFDVTARKKQTDFHIAGFCQSDSSYQITVSNAKPLAQDVLVVEPIPGDWQITAENMHHTKSSASSANWTMRVPADSHAEL
ncbi:MAG: DUF4139 domain-containing protein, partial [Candidatus Eremiobacteraeota bacterium]|nr:DUF4139 domain-containing protein [Candidatus Eremiobacteraeota bacterium]